MADILSLNSKKAFDFFMNAERYETFELPDYFNFQPILDYVREKIGNKEYDDCITSSNPEDMKNINLDILLNKDGKYAIRPLSLVNPYLYYFLIREICNKGNWKLIRDSFKRFQTPHIKACAIPIIPEKKEDFHNSTAILNWWNSMEQSSIEFSLDYKYMFVTDITNCYGSINPKIIATALAMKDTKQENTKCKKLADNILKYMRALQNGRNIGIPQGSEVFNLMAEIILGYADLLLAEAIAKKLPDCKYDILRYRDDYRIFCNDKGQLDEISYLLRSILLQLGFQMNSKKTMVSDNIITDSIKEDKQFYIFNTPIFKRRKVYDIIKDKNGNQTIATRYEEICDFNGLQKNLLFILLYGRKYPNSGQIRVLLNKFSNRVPLYFKGFAKRCKANNYFYISLNPMIAILTQIANENVTAAHYALKAISQLLNRFEDNTEKNKVVEKVCKKLGNQHETKYLEIWLQNLAECTKNVTLVNSFDQPLCKLAAGIKETELWNNSWIKPAFKKDFPYNEICNDSNINELKSIMKIKSRNPYDILDEYDDIKSEIQDSEDEFSNVDDILDEYDNIKSEIQDSEDEFPNVDDILNDLKNIKNSDINWGSDDTHSFSWD